MIELRDLHLADLPAAAQLLARSMRDDPMHCAVFGSDPVRRVNRLGLFFGALLPRMGQVPSSAWDAGQLVGVLGLFAPGRCFPTLRQQIQIALPMLTLRLGELWRLWHWTRVSEEHDLKERHWHLGPVAVDADRQRQGIGSLLLRAFCERMDRESEVAFLETDKLDSVRFYARCGFEVTAQDNVLGTTNWWMRRSPLPLTRSAPSKANPLHQGVLNGEPGLAKGEVIRGEAGLPIDKHLASSPQGQTRDASEPE